MRSVLGTSAKELLPSIPTFAGHQTFAPRSGWLKKGIDALSDPKVGGEAIFSRSDALVTLGVGKNMVSSIRFWLLATGMAYEEREGNARVTTLKATPLGTLLFGDIQSEGYDPYIEDEATPWLLHLNLCGPRSTAFSWVWAFHLWRETDFSREVLTDAIQNATETRVPRPPSRETVSRDVDCLLHTYLPTRFRENAPLSPTEDTFDSPLSALGLIRPAFDHRFRFVLGPKPSLPPEIWAYALIHYWKSQRPQDLTVPAQDIWHAEGGPGRLFKLDEDSVYAYLDTLAETTKGAYRFDDSGLIRQILRDPMRSNDFDTLTLIRKYYD